MLYWFLKYFLIGPTLRMVFRPWVVGGENLPRSGAVIMAGNHLSFIDSIFHP
ncbi:MAG TPA: 1-acyl-sn-glycerol-3-phosphate acyltransferase, partial [Microbacteriaceae bacterium]|nr:1-acyl-sn-glycerol-3-phosphate acyltransferase [Microbacteriaceae bacterium]